MGVPLSGSVDDSWLDEPVSRSSGGSNQPVAGSMDETDNRPAAQSDMQPEVHADKQTESHADKQTDDHIHNQLNKQADVRTSKQSDVNTDRQLDNQPHVESANQPDSAQDGARTSFQWNVNDPWGITDNVNDQSVQDHRKTESIRVADGGMADEPAQRQSSMRTVGHTDRQADVQPSAHTFDSPDSQTDEQMIVHKDIQSSSQTDNQTDRQLDKHTDAQPDEQADDWDNWGTPVVSAETKHDTPASQPEAPRTTPAPTAEQPTTSPSAPVADDWDDWGTPQQGATQTNSTLAVVGGEDPNKLHNSEPQSIQTATAPNGRANTDDDWDKDDWADNWEHEFDNATAPTSTIPIPSNWDDWESQPTTPDTPQPPAFTPPTPSDNEAEDWGRIMGDTDPKPPSWRKPLIITLAVIVALAALGGGGYAVYRGVQAMQARKQEQSQIAERDNKLVQLQSAWAKEQQAARALIEQAKTNGVYDEQGATDIYKQLEKIAARKPMGEQQLQSDLSQLKGSLDLARTAYDTSMNTRIQAVAKRLKELMAKADSLKNAPDGDDRKRMLALADQWRNTSIDEANVAEASKACDDLTALTGKVEQAKRAKEEQQKAEREKKEREDRERKAREQAEAEAQRQAQEQAQQQYTPDYSYQQYVPQQTVPQPQYTAPAQPAQPQQPQQTVPQPAPSGNSGVHL